MENRLDLSVQVSQDQQNNSVLYPETVSLLCLFLLFFLFKQYLCFTFALRAQELIVGAYVNHYIQISINHEEAKKLQKYTQLYTSRRQLITKVTNLLYQ